MNNEIKLGDIVVFKTGIRTFEVVGKYIVPDDRLWRVEAITENDPPTPDRNRKYRLVAVDCPNVILENIPERYVEFYSEKLERELEEQRKEALKMNRNEIKQGDKVRVAKDIPQFYLEYNSYRMFEIEHRVVDVNMEDGFALLDSIPPKFTTILPTKYLVKVDAEAKEANVKIGDKVVVHYPSGDRIGRIKEVMLDCTYDIDFGGGCTGHNITRSQIELYTAPKIKVGDRVRNVKSNECGIVLNIRNGVIEVGIPYVKPKRYWSTNIVECVEPTEQTEAEKKPNVGSIKIPVEVDLTDSYWDAYASDLAKEVALKVANKFNDPEQAAEYAVKVAKAVVEGLKRK